jgi:hypothetical protein
MQEPTPFLLFHTTIRANPYWNCSSVWREYGRDEIIASVRCLCQQGGSDYELALSYRTRGEQDMSYRIAITHETRFIGKKVPVFLCPLCCRPARKLYLPHVALHFGCRTCHDLAYRSCQTAHRYDRGHVRKYEMHKRTFPRVRAYYRLSSEPIHKIAWAHPRWHQSDCSQADQGIP